MLIVTLQSVMLVMMATIFVVFRRPRSARIPAGTERFRFGNARWMIVAYCVLFSAFGDYLWAFPQRPQGPNAVYAYAFLADVMPAIFLYSFVYYWALYVDLNDSDIAVATLFGVERWPYSSVGKADISTGFAGRRPMNATMLYDTRGRKIVRVTGNFNDYSRFISLLKDRLRPTDALVLGRSNEGTRVIKSRARK